MNIVRFPAEQSHLNRLAYNKAARVRDERFPLWKATIASIRAKEMPGSHRELVNILIGISNSALRNLKRINKLCKQGAKINPDLLHTIVVQILFATLNAKVLIEQFKDKMQIEELARSGGLPHRFPVYDAGTAEPDQVLDDSLRQELGIDGKTGK